MFEQPQRHDPVWRLPSTDRRHAPGSVLLFDPRRYRQHRGQFLYADRVFVGSVWTPFVRLRARVPRAADGGTEI
jgi:hypothetical protein